MKQPIVLLLHFAFWLICIFLILIPLGIISQSKVINEDEFNYYLGIIFGLIVVPAVFSFYSFYTFLFQRYFEERKIIKIVIYGLGLTFLSLIFGSLALLLTVDFTLSCHKEGDFLTIPIMLLVGIVFGSIALILKGFLTWLGEIKLKEELLEKNQKMEMALVKSQLDPHFLFNTINNIDVLILKDSNKASNYLNKLSDIMRFMLYETKIDKIPLEKEISYIEKYIELQKIRTSNSNYVSYKVLGNVEGKYISPMIFIPFIENAFKHTDNKKLENAITIEIEITSTNIILKCANRFNSNKRKGEDHLGLGNELIRRRLNLIYPQKHILEVNQYDNEYRVKLIVSYGKV